MAYDLSKKWSDACGLNDAEKTVVRALRYSARQYGRNQQIAAAGSKPTHCALVIDGLVARYKVSVKGQRQVVSLHVPGDLVDLHGFVLKTLDHAIEAATSATVGWIDHGELSRTIAEHPSLTRCLAWELAFDAALARESIAAMGRRTAVERIAHFLTLLYFRLDNAGLARDGKYELMMSQSEISDVAGISTVHVNRSLQTLRAEGLLKFSDHQVELLNLEALKALAHFDRAFLALIRTRDTLNQNNFGPRPISTPSGTLIAEAS